MPQRSPCHRPLRLRASRPQRDESTRPNAAARGYCSVAWRRLRQAALIRDAWQCQDCGRICTDKREAQVDHVVPKSKGGADELANLRTLCIRCHARKTNAERRDGEGGRCHTGSV
jgi:5-methylcytosine-specific restriction protein A